MLFATNLREGWSGYLPLALPFIILCDNDVATEEREQLVLLEWLRESRSIERKFLDGQIGGRCQRL